MPGDAAQATKPPAPLAAPGTSVTPPESASASVSLPARSQEEDIVFGTSQLEGSHFRSRGQVQYMRDPKTGDHITRVLPPRPTPQEEQTPLLIAPQIYPDMFGPYGPAYGPPHYAPSAFWRAALVSQRFSRTLPLALATAIAQDHCQGRCICRQCFGLPKTTEAYVAVSVRTAARYAKIRRGVAVCVSTCAANWYHWSMK